MKGLHDIRMVYNATSSGLNDSVWAPWFSLPTVELHLRAVVEGTYMADNDLGEMFFKLHVGCGYQTLCRSGSCILVP